MMTTQLKDPATTTGDEPTRADLDGYRAQRVAALQERRRQLELHLERCRATAAVASDALRPSVGRDIDDTHATLAMVRAELSRLR